MRGEDDFSQLPHCVSEWAPLATGSLVSALDSHVAALQKLSPEFRLLAINGDGDTEGGKNINRLADLAGATAVELTGCHGV